MLLNEIKTRNYDLILISKHNFFNKYKNEIKTVFRFCFLYVATISRPGVEFCSIDCIASTQNHHCYCLLCHYKT